MSPYINSYQFGIPWTGRTLYWVGVGGSWDATAGTKWALSSGGVGGEAVPTSNDDVIFDLLSGNCTISNSSVCRSASLVTYGGILSQGSVTWTIYGALLFGAGMTYTLTTNSDLNNIKFAATSGSWYVSTAGKTMSNARFDGVGGSWVLFDDWTANRRMYLDNGTLDTGNNDVTALAFISSNSNVRSLRLGSSTFNLSSATGFEFWSLNDPTNLTFDAGTSTINGTGGVSGVMEFYGGGQTYYNVSISQPNNATCTVYGANTFNDLTCATTVASYDRALFLDDDQIVNGTLTLSGNSEVNRYLIASSSREVQRTLTAGAVVASYMDFRDMVGAGAANWDLSGATGRTGDCFGNSGITFSTPRTVYWYRNTGNFRSSTTQWFTETGGTGVQATFPLPQDTGKFDANSFNTGTRVITCSGGSTTVPVRIGSIDWTGVTNTPNFTSNDIQSYGDIKLVSGMTHTRGVSLSWEFRNRDARTFDHGGLTWGGSTNFFVYMSATGSMTQQSAFTCNSNIDIVDGTWITGNNALTNNAALTVGNSGAGGSLTTGSGLLTVTNNISHQGGTLTVGSGGLTITRYSSSISPVALYMGSGTWTLTSTGTVFDGDSGQTIDGGTATILCTNTSASTKTFAGASNSFYNLTVSGLAAAGTFTITGSNSFNNLTFNPLSNIRLTASTTQTVTGTCSATGTAGNTIVVRSTSATNATISSANNVTWDYVTLTDLTGTGGGTFTATNSTDGGGNVNWTITP